MKPLQIGKIFMIRSSYCCEFKSAATNEILDAIYEGFEIDIISVSDAIGI